MGHVVPLSISVAIELNWFWLISGSLLDSFRPDKSVKSNNFMSYNYLIRYFNTNRLNPAVVYQIESS